MANVKQNNSPNPKESGLTLDIARRFYSVDTIKKFIDTLAQSGGTFLHLHLSDHENYALESHLLNQREEQAVQKKDVYYNPNTNKPFLTYKQMREIIDYAQKKKIEIVPEIDSPNHMTAIFNLLEIKHGKAYVDNLKSHNNPEEINITKPESIEMIKGLIAEVIHLFGQNTEHFHIGGDEFGYSKESNYEYITYANQLNQFIHQKGLITRIWNDGIIKANLAKLDKNIEITYWSYDGDTQDEKAMSTRRTLRASLPDLLENGFKVLNYNSYYLYFVPDQYADFRHDANYAAHDVAKHWHLGVWDKQNQTAAVGNHHNLIGAAMSIWGEESGTLSDEAIRESATPLLRAVIEKTNDSASH